MSTFLGVWCPTCREHCIPIHGHCGFCDTRITGKRGGWKRPDLVGRIDDRKLATLLTIWLLVIPMLTFMAWASVRGFDDSMCRAYNGCPWRNT